jgi:hypothetical protein
LSESTPETFRDGVDGALMRMPALTALPDSGTIRIVSSTGRAVAL